MISFCFDEVAKMIDTKNCMQHTIIADKKSSLQAFHGTISSGVKYDNILDKDMCLFFESMKKEIAVNDFILKQDLDKLLLESGNFQEKHIDGQITFHGFLPFKNAKVLIKVAAKYYAQADAITYEFGDSEFTHLWINTWKEFSAIVIFSWAMAITILEKT
jgi:hypothetical protein